MFRHVQRNTSPACTINTYWLQHVVVYSYTPDRLTNRHLYAKRIHSLYTPVLLRFPSYHAAFYKRPIKGRAAAGELDHTLSNNRLHSLAKPASVAKLLYSWCRALDARESPTTIVSTFPQLPCRLQLAPPTCVMLRTWSHATSCRRRFCPRAPCGLSSLVPIPHFLRTRLGLPYI